MRATLYEGKGKLPHEEIKIEKNSDDMVTIRVFDKIIRDSFIGAIWSEELGYVGATRFFQFISKYLRKKQHRVTE